MSSYEHTVFNEDTALETGGYEKCHQICHFPGWD